MKYDEELGRISQIHSFPFSANNSYHNFNGVIANNAGNNTNVSEFFTILNDRVVKIGEKPDAIKSVARTVFYPERNMMVQVTGGGIWVYDFEFDEYVSEYDEVVPVAQTGLLGNFPNPFNPSTSIKYQVSGISEFVRIEVYNIRGQRVRTLLDGSREFGIGEHSVVWDGRDDSGGLVSSGVYFYRMRAGDYVSVRRMVLLK